MAPTARSKDVAAATAGPKVRRAAGTKLQITAYRNGYLIKGDISVDHPRLKDFATWNERSGAWYITARRAYEYDHHYGLRLFSKRT